MTLWFSLRQRRGKALFCNFSSVAAGVFLWGVATPGYSQHPSRKPTINAALLRAAEKNRVAEVKSLLTKGANPNVKGPLGYTPIMLLALHPKLDATAVQALQKAGGNIDAVDTVGTTALMHACANDADMEASVSVLLAQGAKTNLADPNGATALMTVAEKGGEKTAPLLLAHGAKVDLQNRNGQTALFLPM